MVGDFVVLLPMTVQISGFCFCSRWARWGARRTLHGIGAVGDQTGGDA